MYPVRFQINGLSGIDRGASNQDVYGCKTDGQFVSDVTSNVPTTGFLPFVPRTEFAAELLKPCTGKAPTNLNGKFPYLVNDEDLPSYLTSSESLTQELQVDPDRLWDPSEPAPYYQVFVFDKDIDPAILDRGANSGLAGRSRFLFTYPTST